MTIRIRETVEYQATRHAKTESCRQSTCVQTTPKTAIDDACRYCNQYVRAFINKEASPAEDNITDVKAWLDTYETIEGDPLP